MSDYTSTDEARIDRWLCAVRLVKTRPLATQLCEGGHVRVNGNATKPSTKVRAGDRVDALIAERERILEVVRPIDARVGAPARTSAESARTSGHSLAEASAPRRGHGKAATLMRRGRVPVDFD